MDAFQTHGSGFQPLRALALVSQLAAVPGLASSKQALKLAKFQTAAQIIMGYLERKGPSLYTPI